MYKLLSLVSGNETLAEYASSKELERSYKQYGLDGLEIICCGNDDRHIIDHREIIGVHLPFYGNWLDLWYGNKDALLEEYGSDEVWQKFYNGQDKTALLAMFQEALDYAQSVAAKYVVFHVSNVTTKEVFTRRYRYSDEEVIDASAQLINQLLDGKHYAFDFLMENLCFAGLTFTNPRLTRRLLDQVHYPQKGILLDTGHVMCTNPDLKSEGEAYDYIGQMLSLHGELCRYIKGMHLHCSVTGAFAKRMLQNPPPVKEDFWGRFSQAYELVGKIDAHQVTTHPKALECIKRIAPDYLTLEFCAKDRKEREEKLKQQCTAIGTL